MKEHVAVWIFPVGLMMLAVMVTSCHEKNDPAPGVPSGTITLSVDHRVKGQVLKCNELQYVNAAGNEYLITDLMYFISGITFYRNDGVRKVIACGNGIFYINEAIPGTKAISFADQIPAGSYDSITFMFGLSPEVNKSYLFVNPPEVLMGWPEVLGGGYHHMMMNGKWKDPSGNLMPFNFHMGTGQLYHGNSYNVDSIYAYTDNSFLVLLRESSFQLADKETLHFQLTMNIDQWFENPHVYDHNFWGGAIMQKQPAMQMAKENGWNVFSIATK
jgi:hypothetical protein